MRYSSAIFSIIILLSCTICGIWGATQWIAVKLQYPVEFGNPLFVTKNGIGIYFPLSYLVWAFKYQGYLPKYFSMANLWIYGGVLMGFVYAILTAMYRDKSKKVLTSRGSASWATQVEIEKSGLLENKGVVLGKKDDIGAYLRSNGPDHILVSASTGAGKGISVIITTLLTWIESVFVIDIKGENWGITSKFRKEKLGQYVMKFEPANPDGSSVKFNPLEEIRYKTGYELADTQTIANIIVDPGEDNKGDSHWINTASAFLTGVILHLLYKGNGYTTLPEVATFIADLDNSLKEMQEYKHGNFEEFKKIYGECYNLSANAKEKVLAGTHPRVLEAAIVMAGKPEKERGSVASTAAKSLELYRDPIIGKNISYSEFKIKDLMQKKRPVSLYMVIEPKDINRVKPLTRLIITQMLSYLTEAMSYDQKGDLQKSYNHRLLLLLDEFPALGKLELFETAISYVRGYGMKAMVIIQDIKQMDKIYTQNNSIFSNCNIRLAYPPNDEKTAELLSKLLGKQTIEIEQKSYSGGRLTAWLKNQNISIQEIERALMTPDELLSMSEKKIIIFKRNCKPILGDRIEYYNDPNFIKRKLGPLVKSDKTILNADKRFLKNEKEMEVKSKKEKEKEEKDLEIFSSSFIKFNEEEDV